MTLMAKRTSNPGSIHLRIVEVLKRFPLGATGGQIRQELEKEGLKPEEQTHLDRRKRDLKKWFVMQKLRLRGKLTGKDEPSPYTSTLERRAGSQTKARLIRKRGPKSFMLPTATVRCVARQCRNMELRWSSITRSRVSEAGQTILKISGRFRNPRLRNPA
jgi:hypothetical protein